jgi:ferrous-iron efflux pump FieF
MQHTPSSNTPHLIRMATSASLFVAGILIILKLGAWAYTDSLSLLSSLVDSVLDIAASIINFIAARYALQPPDEDHRFGHGKAEDLAALGQAIFIAGSGLFITFEAVRRLVLPTPIDHSEIGIGVMIISIILTTGLVLFQRYVIMRTTSNIVKADSLHYLTDILSNLAVIAAIIASTYFGWLYADPLMAIAIAALIIGGAIHIAKNGFNNLMDREFEDEERDKIIQIVNQHPKSLGLHDLKTRRSGIYSFIQFHLDLDENLSLREAHDIGDEVEDMLKVAFPNADVLIHQDPTTKDN